MSTLVIADPLAPTLFDVPGGEPMLDEILVGVWEGLAARGTSDCPVCGGEMRAITGAWRGPAASAHGRPPAGSCLDCGSSLA